MIGTFGDSNGTRSYNTISGFRYSALLHLQHMHAIHCRSAVVLHVNVLGTTAVKKRLLTRYTVRVLLRNSPDGS